MIITKASLKESVEDLLLEILVSKSNGQLRCHEIARLFKTGLTKEGYEGVVVKDGVAVYNHDYLQAMTFKFLTDFDPDIDLSEIVGPSKTHKDVSYFHSWCEVGDYVIDHHNALKQDENTIHQRFTIVEKKQDLVGKVTYDPCGKRYRVLGMNFLYVPPRFVTRVMAD